MEKYQKDRYVAAAESLSRKLERRNFQPIICQSLKEASQRKSIRENRSRSVGRFWRFRYCRAIGNY